jgi:hypothetical protein
MTDSLDALLNEALAEAGKRRVRNAAQPKPTPRLNVGMENPENWTQTRTVSLIHRGPGGQTLLGNFNEFTYNYIRGTRKLCRVEGPTETDGMEFVEGDWWLTGETQKFAEPAQWVETREAECGITLAECGLHSPDARVRVRLEFNGIARVELARETRFTSLARDTFLILPVGVDLLCAMSFDSKLALRAEIGL